MKLTKKFLAATLLASTLLMTGCGGKLNIGYVDIMKIEDTPQMTKIIDEGHQKIAELQEQAEKDLQGKSEEELTKLQEEYQRKARGIQQAYDTQLKHKLDTVLAEISEAKDLDAVIESSADMPTILHGGVDLTDEVVQKLQ